MTGGEEWGEVVGVGKGGWWWVRRGNFAIRHLHAPNCPPVCLPHLSGLLPLHFQSVSIYCAASPPREGVDDVIVSAGVSRASVAIPADWCRQPRWAKQASSKCNMSQHIGGRELKTNTTRHYCSLLSVIVNSSTVCIFIYSKIYIFETEFICIHIKSECSPEEIGHIH